MTSSKFADILELALIELDYAVADFLDQKPIVRLEARRNELEALLAKLAHVDQTVRNAIAALDAIREIAGAKSPPRKARRGRFAA